MEKLIELKNVAKVYKKHTVLENVHTTLYKGETVAIVGKNGAGKSTFLKLIGGLSKPTKGTVHFHKETGTPGFVVEQFPQELRFTLAGYLQHMGRIQGLSKKKRSSRIEELLETFEMVEFRHEEIISFSKGMKQKVNMMQALLSSSKLLLLDEPLSGLDARAQLEVERIFTKLKERGMTIVFTCHEERLIHAVADRVITIGSQRILKNERVQLIEHLTVIEANVILNKPLRLLKEKCTKIEQHGNYWIFYIDKKYVNEFLAELLAVQAEVVKLYHMEREEI
ncbi:MULTISPECIES: ATP-binding cassette domain-containing protein [Priestia]|jgi:ABC-type multidrug transport system ATPase subunit|uniref:ATP-binding cassette domain-containing protein n=1 Tax=Priestia TaxID=2800373 RepID=UPI0018A291D3|nr:MULTISPECIES: ABC transporter ATP-binding protein [Priestia]MDR7243195.1 ABC-type multidrug transport system ATPase subunit [Priestia megaterium]QTL48433.1 ABC transporter ATP-binding protein [Priestia aryabhattai]USL41384.1 ABC transporter ATP-binding protein [Priestia megaterium]